MVLQFNDTAVISMGGIIEETGNQWYTFGHVRLGILIRNQSGDVNQPDEYKGLKFRLGR